MMSGPEIQTGLMFGMHITAPVNSMGLRIGRIVDGKYVPPPRPWTAMCITLAYNLMVAAALQRCER